MEFDSNPIQKREGFSLYIELPDQTGIICVCIYIFFPLFGIWIKLIHGSNCMTSKWQQVSSWCCVCTLVPSQVTERFNSIGPLPMKPEETSWVISIYPYVCLSLSHLRTFLYDVKKGDFDIHVCMLIKFLVNQF